MENMNGKLKLPDGVWACEMRDGAASEFLLVL
jgi:hypothetical protein